LDNYPRKSGLTKLHQEMDGLAPDQAKSSVQYEKGFQLLHELESITGEKVFQSFMHTFINKY
jgi:aminopeptidase N